MMNREASADESAVDEPRYFCYKAYIKLVWVISELFLYGLAPLSALLALIHADFEWLFPSYAMRALFPSFTLVLPVLFTIFSYILYWLIDLVIDVQQVSDNLLDMEVWKRCVWASVMLISNIYSVLLAVLVLQLIYYQHCAVIEEQVMHEQQNINEEGARYLRYRRQHPRQFINQPPNAGIQQNREDLNNNQADVENVQ
ncbi:unnamed protein product [Litomosoides sigmodontis]|uniref:Uncharacterized protein n=1 Tax=Litomosoides sigmodontis TaxID=42156 RepID=A0A3P6UQR7_LITSI|nr:unnamed protein product [Litomosoides sigmodontis]